MIFLLESDHNAYMEIYNRYSKGLYMKTLQKVGDKDESKDLLQEVFTALWQNRFSLTIDTPLGGYLYATLRYMIIKRIAHENVRANYLSSLSQLSLIDDVLTDGLVRERELKQVIEKEISLLPDKMQKVFRMSRERHLSHKEIAFQLGLSESTVKKHINNALKSLRVKLGAFSILIGLTLTHLFF
ncbi:RNA polymerase sigma-70 factor [Sphingobacterium yanglingense]|nr:RNA polymerase sigma-70 factor [Sphingobacterium yanglingense]